MFKSLEGLRRSLTPEERVQRELAEAAKQAGALQALGMHKHGSWLGYGKIEANVDSINEETGVHRVETRLIYPRVDADVTTMVAVGAALLPTGERVIYATSDGIEIFNAPYVGQDLRREVSAALRVNAAERENKRLLPPHVVFSAA